MLRIYEVALKVLEEMQPGIGLIERRDRDLARQMRRAASSVVLNIAEGSGQEPGDARRNHYRIAMGSAAEVSAVIDLAGFADGGPQQEELRRVAAMLFRMAR